MRLLVLLSAAVVLGFCCWPHLSVAQSGAALHSPAQTAWGFDLMGMDRSVVPTMIFTVMPTALGIARQGCRRIEKPSARCRICAAIVQIRA